jgi:hypothetical protein
MKRLIIIEPRLYISKLYTVQCTVYVNFYRQTFCSKRSSCFLTEVTMNEFNNVMGKTTVRLNVAN